LWRLAFGLLLVAQLIILYVPIAPGGLEIPWVDKVIHLLIFGAPAVAALMMGLRPRWVLGILAAHAPISELVQHVALPHRGGDVFDVMADLTGVVLGGLAYLVWSRRRS